MRCSWMQSGWLLRWLGGSCRTYQCGHCFKNFNRASVHLLLNRKDNREHADWVGRQRTSPPYLDFIVQVQGTNQLRERQGGANANSCQDTTIYFIRLLHSSVNFALFSLRQSMMRGPPAASLEQYCLMSLLHFLARPRKPLARLESLPDARSHSKSTPRGSLGPIIA